MYCVKCIDHDLFWVGGNDRRLAMFEGVYSVPDGISYNSYLLLDQQTVLFDTVDKSVSKIFFENIEHVLNGRNLDYLIVQHMEPDHSATIANLLMRYPDVTVICNEKTAVMINQFFKDQPINNLRIVTEGEILNTGSHEMTFLMAPMVHWPEVMVTYDKTKKILFSADAFGTFSALNGAIFADEVDFERDYLDEARRYYTNIVGKYGTQVQAILKKAASVEIDMICPLHGFVWRNKLGDYIEKYQRWSAYVPEEEGVMIAYASVYGNTENAAEILSSKLRDKGIKTVMFDVSVTPASEIIAAAFKWSHLVFASTTYNAGIFIKMEDLLRDLAAHNIQNRTIAFIENGSWAPTSGNLMRKIFSSLKNITFIDKTVSILSSLKSEQVSEIDALASSIIATISKADEPDLAQESQIEPDTLFKLSYGLFVLTAKDGEEDNGCIINTVSQLTDKPKRLAISVNKANYTHDIILKTGVLNLSVLTQDAPFKLFEHFGFKSGKESNKFAEYKDAARSVNGLFYITRYTNAFLSCKVTKSIDCGTHTLFIADVTEAKILSAEPSVTYDYYFAHIKPKPPVLSEIKKGFVCKVCGYVYEGDTLPADFICPLCKHGVEAFEPLN